MKSTMNIKQINRAMLCVVGVLCMAANIRAGVVLDFRPELSGAANPGDGTTRINVTAGTYNFPISPFEIATPLIGNLNAVSSLSQGQTWGGAGLNIDGSVITFTLTEIVDYNGAANSGAVFKSDAIGLGMGIDSPVAGEHWWELDGQESFTWTASEYMQWEGLTLRTFGSNNTRELRVSSPEWIGLSGVSPGAGVTFDPVTGTFTMVNSNPNVVDNGLTLIELVGPGGPTLYFSSIKIENKGGEGTAIKTITLGGSGTPELTANPEAYTMELELDSTLSVTAPGVLENDVYTGAQTVSALLVNTTPNGTLNLSADGSFTYDPDPGFGGTDSFTYKAYTSVVTSETVQVSITVIEPFAPVVAAPLPFYEPFDPLTDGALDGQNDWAVLGGSAVVQTNVFQNGGKAVDLTGSAISRQLSTSSSIIWASFWAWCGEPSDENPVVMDDDASVVFYINTNQNLVVYDNTTPVVLGTVIPTNAWTCFDVYCDYESMTWNLSVNKTNVAAGLSLYSTNQIPNSVLVQNGSASSVYMDELSIADQEPVSNIIDTDGDSIADWWEQKYFGGITNAPSVATNVHSYTAGLSAGEFFVLSGWPAGWEGQPGRRYAVYTTTNLTTGFTFQTNIPWYEAENVELGVTEEPVLFYRVSVELDD